MRFEISAEAVAEQERALSALCTRAVHRGRGRIDSGIVSQSRGEPRALDASAGLALVAFTVCLASAIWIFRYRTELLRFPRRPVARESGRRESGRHRGLPGAERMARADLRHEQ